MSTQTGIEWCDATWNPIAGCSVVSPGCTNCYAMKMAHRLEAMGSPKYAGLTVNRNGHAVWTGKIALDEKALLHPLSWKKPRRVFVNSMSDLFHEGVPFDFVDRVFAVMALCPHHTFQVLTKRPERAAEYLNAHQAYERVLQFAKAFKPNASVFACWPLPNVWLGTSCEDQQRANERIPHLLRCPAAVRFLSCEPLLGPIDLEAVSRTVGAAPDEITEEDDAYGPPLGGIQGIDWVIVGGESGPGSRPCDVEWIRSIVRQCKAAGVACFVKQLGTKPTNREGVPHPSKDSKGGDMSEFPEDLRVREFPEATP